MDILLGDPRRLPHPVSLIGRAIAFGEHRLHSGSSTRDLRNGVLLVIAVITIVAATAWALIVVLQVIDWRLGALAATLIAWSTLAARGLNDAALAVEQHLCSSDESSARREIRALVGRDPDTLDRTGLVRAAIESVAENASDGVVAPLLFLFVGGPVAALVYKTINTLDSMVGYKGARYFCFGRFAARLDDFANLLPARLTAVGIACAAGLVTGRTLQSFQACVADAHKHESPNAGYPEAAMAGALGVELGAMHTTAVN